MNFVCERCDEGASEVVARFCKECKRSYIAGYICDPCDYEDIDPPGQEWGHKPHEVAS